MQGVRPTLPTEGAVPGGGTSKPIGNSICALLRSEAKGRGDSPFLSYAHQKSGGCGGCLFAGTDGFDKGWRLEIGVATAITSGGAASWNDAVLEESTHFRHSHDPAGQG